MSEAICSQIKKIVESANDCLIIVKDNSIDSISYLDFGEVNVKFHDKKIKQIDKTDKKRY